MTRMPRLTATLLLLALTLACLTVGCAPTIVPSKGPRPATNPSAVALFQDPPAKYEELGIVRTEGSFEWQEVGQIQNIIDELKLKAAALGANGLLLQVPDMRLRGVGTYDEEPYTIPIDKAKSRNAMATAIYVHQK